MRRSGNRKLLCSFGIAILIVDCVMANEPRSHIVAPMAEAELKDRVNELVRLYQSGRDEATIELMSIYSSYYGGEIDYAINDDGSTAKQVIGDILREYASRTRHKDIDIRCLDDIGRLAARDEQADLDATWSVFLQYVESNRKCTSWGVRDFDIMLRLIGILNDMLRSGSKDMDARKYVRVLTMMEWVYIAAQRQELNDRRSGMAVSVARNCDIAAMGTLSRFALAENDEELRDMLWHRISMQQLELQVGNSLGRDFSKLNRKEMIQIVNSHYRDVKKAGGLNRIFRANADSEDANGPDKMKSGYSPKSVASPPEEGDTANQAM